MKNKKLSLSELKIKSFVTGKEVNMATVKGGLLTQEEGCSGTAMTADCTVQPCGPFHRHTSH